MQLEDIKITNGGAGLFQGYYYKTPPEQLTQFYLVTK